MQQIVSAINIRRSVSDRERKREISWAVKSISTFVAAGYMSEDKSGIDAANNLTIDEIERQILDSGLVDEPKEEAMGSTEALLRAFGGRP